MGAQDRHELLDQRRVIPIEQAGDVGDGPTRLDLDGDPQYLPESPEGGQAHEFETPDLDVTHDRRVQAGLSYLGLDG